MVVFTPYVRLMRPANIVTAWADILAGIVASGIYLPVSLSGLFYLTGGYLEDLIWLLISTTGLYGGGVVMNDVFDLELDREERPERPLPSSRASLRGASLLGIGLLLLGVLAAAQVGARSAWLAFATGLLAVIYDAYGKHHTWLGPLNMGACRGGNLLLGMSILPLAYWSWLLALIPVAYIAAITLISRGEVGGSNRTPLYGALSTYLLIFAGLLTAGFFAPYEWWVTIPFLFVFGALILPPLFRAIRQPSGPRIGKAVRAGVLALIAMDASLAAAFGGWRAALLILLLLPLSILIARNFAVT